MERPRRTGGDGLKSDPASPAPTTDWPSTVPGDFPVDGTLQALAPGIIHPGEWQHVEAGCRLGNFNLLAELGRGSFAKVFLAEQVSLGRRVALKVSANTSSEARTMASLEHPHIVQVYDETVDPQWNLRLLWMRGSTPSRVSNPWFPLSSRGRCGVAWKSIPLDDTKRRRNWLAP